MNSSLRWIAMAVGFSLAVAACKKKDTAETDAARGPGSQQTAQAQAQPDSSVPSNTPSGDGPGTSSTSAPPITASAAPTGADQAAYEAWFKKYNLDLTDPKMLDADPDEDGFSNREEFLADTDPHDKNSRHGIHKGIRLKEYSEVRLPLELVAIEGDKAQIRRTDQPDAKPISVKAGDTIKGLPLKVVHVEEKVDFDKAGEKTNFSQVALEDSSTREKIVLMKDLPARTAATFAVLVSPDGKTTLKVRRGDVFSWPAEQSSRYKVIDLSQDQAVLLQLDTNKTWTIPRM